MPYLQATLIRKSTRRNLREADCPIRKAIRIRVSRGNPTRKRSTVLKESTRERDTQICPKLNDTIAEKMAIMHISVQNHMIMLILHKKMTETRDLRI